MPPLLLPPMLVRRMLLRWIHPTERNLKETATSLFFVDITTAMAEKMAMSSSCLLPMDFGRFPDNSWSSAMTKNDKSSSPTTTNSGCSDPANRQSTDHTNRKKYDREQKNCATKCCLPHSRIMVIGSSQNELIINTITSPAATTKTSLREDWNNQVAKRRKGQWIPNGHRTGRWKPPLWAERIQKRESSSSGTTTTISAGSISCSSTTTTTSTKTLKEEGKSHHCCRKSLLPILKEIMEKYAVADDPRNMMSVSNSNPSSSNHHHHQEEEEDGATTTTTTAATITVTTLSSSSPLSSSLHNVIHCPKYVKPTMDLLQNAYAAIQQLLPTGDCEDWEVIQLARSYYDYWRPKETKILLLAESHAFTSKSRALHGPGLDDNLLSGTYFGPRKFLSLVYCLAYGENESFATDKRRNDDTLNYNHNKGTPQFWTLLAACARGVQYVARSSSSSTTTPTARKKPCGSSPFATDLLKIGKLPMKERLEAKLAVLETLRSRGIWLIDTSIFGWYISQPQEYTRSKVSNDIHRKPKSRPPSEMKVPSLLLSWEMYTKHVVREVASEGHLKYLVPIGMEVEAAVTRKRMEDAIRVKGSSGGSDGCDKKAAAEGEDDEARVSDTFPAPNAWIPGGYGPFYAKLAALVSECT